MIATEWSGGSIINLGNLLDSLGSTAYDINNTGQMVGVNEFPAAPEPSTWAMMPIGFAGLGYAGYRRARIPRAGLWGRPCASTAATISLAPRRRTRRHGQPGLPRPLPLCHRPHRLRLFAPRILSSRSIGGQIWARDQPSRPHGALLLRLPLAGRGAVKEGQSQLAVSTFVQPRPPDAPPGMMKLRLVKNT